MKTTYLIESDSRDVIGYHITLYGAKQTLLKLNNSAYRILCVKGPNYGEGYHWYEIRYIDGKFKRTNLK